MGGAVASHRCWSLAQCRGPRQQERPLAQRRRRCQQKPLAQRCCRCWRQHQQRVMTKQQAKFGRKIQMSRKMHWKMHSPAPTHAAPHEIAWRCRPCLGVIATAAVCKRHGLHVSAQTWTPSAHQKDSGRVKAEKASSAEEKVGSAGAPTRRRHRTPHPPVHLLVQLPAQPPAQPSAQPRAPPLTQPQGQPHMRPLHFPKA